MGSDWTAPPIPTPAALVGMGEDEYEILTHIVEKMAKGASKERKKATEIAKPEDEDKDRNFFSLLGATLARSIRNFPAWIKKNWIPLAVVVGIWLFIQLLAGLLNFGFAKTIVFFFGSLTASFNNFLGKAVFAGVVTGMILPAYRFYKQSGIKDLVGKYKKVSGMLRRAVKALGKRAWKVVAASAGVGLISANLLSTNNSLSTWFVCILASLALVNSLAFSAAGGIRDKLFRAAYRDLSKLFGKRKVPSLEMSHAVFGSVAAGLAGSVVPTVLITPFTFIKYITGSDISAGLRGFQEISGYLFGGILVIAAILLHFLLKEKPAKPAGAAAPGAAS